MKNLAIMTLAVIMICIAPHAAAETGGVQVENIPPTISDISFDEGGGFSILSINVTDYNSYRDLKCVYINITNEGQLISSMAYMAGEDVNQTGVLSNVVGKHLDHKSSIIKYSNKTTGIECCFLILEIYFNPVNGGDVVEVSVSDRTGASTTYIGNYVYPVMSDQTSANLLMVILIISLTLSIVLQIIKHRRCSHEI